MANLVPAEDFLRLVWPDTGPYCLASPFVHEGKEVFAHYAVSTAREAAALARSLCLKKKHVFFAIHALVEGRKPHPTIAGRTKVSRAHTNMRECRAFFLDVDVGEGDKKYASLEDARSALDRFLFRTGLPFPYVVSSGGGLHVYWPLTTPVASRDWRRHADRLRWLCNHMDLRVDHSRTTDLSSILRVPGTINYKHGRERPVEVVVLGDVSDTDAFTSQLERLTKNTAYMSVEPSAREQAGLTTAFDGRQTPPDEVFAVCEHMRAFHDQADLPENHWYPCLGTLMWAAGGEELCHTLSSRDPRYSRAETQAKMEQWRDKGPPSCHQIGAKAGVGACDRCELRGAGRNPLDIANKVWERSARPAPVLALATPQRTTLAQPVDVSLPFRRNNGGVGVSVPDEDAPGGWTMQKFLNYDLFPIEHTRGTGSEASLSRWVVDLPLEGQRVFAIDAATLTNQNLFQQKLVDTAIYVPTPRDVNLVRQYMLHYLKDLQQKQRTQALYDHLGWVYDEEDEDGTGEPTAFVLYGRTLDANTGAEAPCSMAANSEFSKPFLRPRGTLEAQIENLKFYDHPFYKPHQFLTLASLASPFLRATGEHGVVIVAVGETGASKSTALYTAAALWGEPKGYVVNGTPDGSTTRARDDRMMLFQNLPICIDEITLFEPDDARRFVFAATQPAGRDALNSKRLHQKHRGGIKSGALLATANKSLNNLVNTRSDIGQAGTVRNIELPFLKDGMPHTKTEADEYLHRLSQAHGHIGPALMVKLLGARVAVEQKIRAERARMNDAWKIAPEERFWVSSAATTFTVGRIAAKLGYHSFDVDALEHWFFTELMPGLRAHVRGEMARTDPEEIIANYLDHVSGELIRIEQDATTGNLAGVFKMPNGVISGRIDISSQEIWLRADRFAQYCTTNNYNREKVIEGLKHTLVLKTTERRVLTRGIPGQEMLRSTCHVLDLAHKAVKGSK